MSYPIRWRLNYGKTACAEQLTAGESSGGRFVVRVIHI